jgi:DNA repair protein RecN (Recombination protein N)
VLDELRISDLGVIDEAVLPLGSGLTVLTGETGAGKTMLISALLLLFGGRADATRVRSGASQTVVDGRVLVGSDSLTRTRVENAGGAIDEDGSLVLRRIVAASGRSRAFIGGAPAPISVLAELADRLVAVHGQSDQLRLIRPVQHRIALDRYAGIDTGNYAVAFDAWRRAAERLADRSTRARELRLEAEMLSRGLDEIAAVAPLPGEDDELAAEASRLGHTDALRVAAEVAHDAILGGRDEMTADGNYVTGLLDAARRALSQTAGTDSELDVLSARLDGLMAAASDVGAELAAYRDGLEADPARLDRVEARRAALSGLLRRYGENIAAVLEWAQSARGRLDELDVSDDALARLTEERDELARQAGVLAAQLSAQRRVAAEKLAEAITAELAALAMAAARIFIEVRPRAPQAGAAELTVDGQLVAAGRTGVDEVEMLLRPTPDSTALPLGRGASGGELSRVMLAIEVCLAGTDPVPTMVFDEVDAGVGGRAAAELGRRLARLACDHQVIVVTHLAQVAAFADCHLVVAKPVAGDSGLSRTDVRVVTGGDRVAELARMLAGTDSATAREHAAELLESSQAQLADKPGTASSVKTARRRDSRGSQRPRP